MGIDKIKFGGSPEDIDDLAGKVLTGEKTATSSLLDYHHAGLRKASKINDCFCVLDSYDKEVAIIRIERI